VKLFRLFYAESASLILTSVFRRPMIQYNHDDKSKKKILNV